MDRSPDINSPTTDSKPKRHFSLRALRFCSFTVGRVCFTLLYLTAAYVVCGRLLMPLAGQYREQLEYDLQSALGHKVTIGSVEGDWRGFSPVISLNELGMQVIPEPGSGISEPARYGLDNLFFHLDVPRSIFERQWVIDDIRASGLSLKIRENGDGRWNLDGIEAGDGRYNDLMIDMLLRLRELRLTDLALTLENAAGQQLLLSNITAAMRNENGVHHLNGFVVMQEQASPLQFSLRLTSDPRESLDGQVWMGFEQLDLRPVTAFMEPWLPAVQPGVLEVSGDIWLRKVEQGYPIFQADIRDLDVEVENPSGSLISLDSFSGRLSAMRQQQAEWQFWAEDMAVTTVNRSWSADLYFARYQVGEGDDPGSVQLQADQVDLALLSGILQIPGVLPQNVSEIMANLSPRGLLRDLRVDSSVDVTDLEQLSVQANVENLAVDAFQGAPAGSGLDGFLAVQGLRGQVEFDSPDLEIYLPRLFREPWQYDSAQGRVRWDIAEDMLRVSSNTMNVSNESMEGQVRFELLRQTDSEGQWMSDFSLLVGVDHIDAITKGAYLPTLPGLADTMQWLDNSIVAGEVYDSGFLYRGSTRRNAPAVTQSTQGLFNVRNGSLRFLPDWPQIDGLEATVLLSNLNADVTATRASTLGLELRDIRAQIRPEESRRGSLLTITGRGEGSTADGLRYLGASPAVSGMHETLSRWQGTGEIIADINLGIHLGNSVTRPEDSVHIDVTSIDSTLQLPDFGLEFTTLNGLVSYDETTGLEAENLQGSLFGYPLAARIETFSMNTEGDRATRITATGRASQQALNDWSLQPAFIRSLLGYAEGETGIEATLTLANQLGADYNNLRLQMDMRDMALSLPRPFDKQAGVSMPLDVMIDFHSDGDDIHVVFDDQLSAHLEMEGSELGRGQILLGSAIQFLGVDGVAIMGELPGSGIVVQGDTPWFDFDAWLAVAENLAGQNTGDRNGPVAGTVSNVEVQMGVFSVFGQELENILTRVTHDGDGWEVYLNNDRISGEIYLPDDETRYTTVMLDYLRFPSPAEPDAEGAVEEEEIDALANVDPTRLPRLSFRTEELVMNDSDAGIWAFTLEPDAGGAFIHDFSVTMDDASITGLGGELPAELFWRYIAGVHTTEFIGEFRAEDLSRVLPRLGIDALVESEDSLISGELAWAGSPVNFSLARSSGRLDVAIDDGRFVNIDAGSSRLLGALNFDSLVRRLQLDFSDLYDSGLTYDSIRGTVDIDQGVVQTDGPFRVVGPSGRISLEGQLDLAAETIDAEMMVSIPIGQNLSVLAGLLGAWPIAISTYLASRIFEEEMGGMTTVLYELEGPLNELQAGFSPADRQPETTSEETASDRASSPEAGELR